jgi:hypothetical protein
MFVTIRWTVLSQHVVAHLMALVAHIIIIWFGPTASDELRRRRRTQHGPDLAVVQRWTRLYASGAHPDVQAAEKCFWRAGGRAGRLGRRDGMRLLPKCSAGGRAGERDGLAGGTGRDAALPEVQIHVSAACTSGCAPLAYSRVHP